jgi:hypothetical protein
MSYKFSYAPPQSRPRGLLSEALRAPAPVFCTSKRLVAAAWPSSGLWLCRFAIGYP